MNQRSLVTKGSSVAGLVLVFALGAGHAARVAAQEASNAPASPPQAADERPPILGAWKLNHELSPRPQPGQVPDRGAGGESGGRSGGRGRGSGGMGGRPGGMGGRPGGFGGGGADEAQMREARELVQEIMTAPESLAITEKPGQVTFTDADGRVRHYMTDGKTEKHQLDTGAVETKTHWSGEQLVMEISSGRGMTLVENYTVDPATRQLVVTLQTGNSPVQGSTRPIRWVYDNGGADR